MSALVLFTAFYKCVVHVGCQTYKMHNAPKHTPQLKFSTFLFRKQHAPLSPSVPAKQVPKIKGYAGQG